MVSPGEQRRAWAYALISRAKTPPPFYGSLEWLALPDGPEKVAAVVLAAEKCMIDWEAAKQLEDQAFAEAAAEHRRSWAGAGFLADPLIEADIEREWREWIGGAA